MSDNTIKTVLLIEDSEDYVLIIKEYLNKSSYQLTSVSNVHDAFEELKFSEYDIIICDLHLPFILNEKFREFPYSVEVGVRTIEELKDVYPNKPILALTAAMESDRAATVRLDHLVPVLYKPVSEHEFLAKLDSLLSPPDSVYTCGGFENLHFDA